MEDTFKLKNKNKTRMERSRKIRILEDLIKEFKIGEMGGNTNADGKIARTIENNHL